MARPDSFSAPAQRADLELAPGIVQGEIIAQKYRVLRVVGRGGMGIVVAASQLSLDRMVAIKLIRSEWAERSLAVERLLREAKAVASIQSEHVARVLDVGTLDSGAPFIVMEYLEGQDLDKLLRRDGAMPASLAIDYLLQACEAIAEAHRNGIVHRDLKPANVFVALGPGGTPSVKVVDFGISKIIGGVTPESLTHPSRVVGSLFHMAPEQMRGKAVDARTDVWALGLLLYEMLTSKRPFRDAPWPDVCARVLSDAAGPFIVPGDELPRELSAIIARCLERQPGGRYQNVAELAVALAPFGGNSSRVSLERIVRVATSTGSLAARTWTPTPPAELSRLSSAADAGRLTPIVPPSEHGLSTKEPVVSSTAPPGPRRQLWLGTALGVAVTSTIASWFIIGGPQRVPREPALGGQPFPASSAEPAMPAKELPATEPPGSLPAPAPPAMPSDPSTEPGTPRVTVLPALPAPISEPAQRPTEPSGAPTAPPTGTVVRAPVPPPSPAAPSPASEILRDDSALAAPSSPAELDPKAAPDPKAEPGAPAAGDAPAAPTAPSAMPPPNAPAPAKVPDAWDLSDIDFKTSPTDRR
jgi:serine/threonine protein kinase